MASKTINRGVKVRIAKRAIGMWVMKIGAIFNRRQASARIRLKSTHVLRKSKMAED